MCGLRLNSVQNPLGAYKTEELRADVLACRSLLESQRHTKALMPIQDVNIKKGPDAVTTNIRDDAPIETLLLASGNRLDLSWCVCAQQLHHIN